MRKKVGLVSSALFDSIYHHESALEIVLSGLFGCFNLSFNVRDVDVRFAKSLLCELHMSDKIHQPFGSMSKGERQNVLIARALITRPEILLLDEPTSGLDVVARAHLQQTVSVLAASGKVTIIYVTHYPEEIPAFINKVLLMRNGRIYDQGPLEAMLQAEKVSAVLNEPIRISRDSIGIFHMDATTPSNIYDICYDMQESR